MTIPRTDPLAPRPEQRVPQRAVRLEKIVEGEIQSQINASLPAQSLLLHEVTAHDDIYGVVQTNGLTITIDAGRTQIDHVVYSHGPTTFTLTASTVNYIVVNAAGGLLASVSPFASGQIPLYMVTTDATSVQQITDVRAVIARGGGGGGGGGSTLDAAYDFGSPGGGRIIDATDGPVLVRNLEADTLPNIELQRATADITTQPSLLVQSPTEVVPRLAIYGDRLQFTDGTDPAGTPVADAWFSRRAANVVGLHDGTTGESLEFRSVAAPAAPGSNITRMYNRVFGTASAVFVKDQNGREFGPLGYKQQATVFGRGGSGGLEPSQSATWSDGLWGTLAPAASWTATGTPSVANNTAAGRGRYADFASGAVSGNDAGIEGQTVFWVNKADCFLFRIELPDATLVRCFIGIAGQTLATMVGADDPGTNALGLQFSTPRADANWKFTERGTSSQTVTDTGSAIAVTPVYFQIILGTITQMVLLDSGFATIATRTVGALGKPGGGTLLRVIVGCETQTAAARSIRVYNIAHHATEA